MVRSFLILGCLVALACGDDDALVEEEAPETEAATPTFPDPASRSERPRQPPVPAGPLGLPNLGLEFDAPAGSAVREPIVGNGDMVQGPGIVVTFRAAAEDTPASLEAATTQAGDDAEDVQPEELDDGWILAWTGQAGSGPIYRVLGRREVGDVDFICEATSSRFEQQLSAITACKSVRAPEPEESE